MIKDILKLMGFTEEPISVSQFQREEDHSAYHAWKIEYPERAYVLKQAKGQELAIYQTYLANANVYAPAFYASANHGSSEYILVEYIPGNNLVRCDRQALMATLDSLIIMQCQFWGAEAAPAALKSRENRRKYLGSGLLEKAYDTYLSDCQQIPATLCHDDLLPFNVIVSQNRAVFIDWEVAGVLPYPASLARLIAHAEETDDAFFYMTDSDKAFAIDYYYENLIKGRGVEYDSFRRSLDLALFYEYCEWVYVGNKYSETDNERFRSYLQKATEMAIQLGF